MSDIRWKNIASTPLFSRIVGGLCVLLIGMGLHSLISHDRTEAIMHTLMAEKGGALLSTLESGLRSNRRGGLMRIDFLLEEIAGRPDVQFVALTGPDGFILRHSNPGRIGEVLQLGKRDITPDEMRTLAPDQSPRWHLLTVEGQDSFVLYKTAGQLVLSPLPEPDLEPGLDPSTPGMRHGMEPGMERGMLGSERMRHGHRPAPAMTIPITLFVGLDPAPLYLAREKDGQRMLLFTGGVSLCGLLGLFALYWARKARTSRKERQAAEALSENMMRSLPDGLIVLDQHGRLSHLNATAERWLGLSDADLDKPAADVLPRALAESAARLLAGHGLPDAELELPGPDPRPVSVRGGHVETPETGRIGSLLLVRDLSERHRLEAEIRRREKLAAVGNLAAGVAHEIRNPLSSIKGYATYFGERFPEGSEDREAARVMVGEVDRLNRVISDLIDLARPADLALKPTDPVALVEDTLRLVRQDAARRGIEVRLENTTTLLGIPGTPAEPIGHAMSDEAMPPDSPLPCPLPLLDPDRMRQVVLNICLNALDAMPDGGTLNWRIRTSGEYLVFEAADSGIGIASELLPTIFDPYFTTKGHGTGLGLATVHKIIEAHGGHILVTSTPKGPGQGTTFRLFLPLHSGDTQ